jgi:hypothetical protein
MEPNLYLKSARKNEAGLTQNVLTPQNLTEEDRLRPKSIISLLFANFSLNTREAQRSR